MRGRHLRIQVGLGLTAALLGVTVFVLLHPQNGPPSLLSHATRLLSLRVYQPPTPGEGGGMTDAKYAWLTNDTLIIARPDAQGRAQILRHDLKIGHEISIPLPPQVVGTLPFSYAMPIPSPDGKWLLWNSVAKGPVVTATNGKHRRSWNFPYIHSQMWLPDSKRIVVTTYGGGLSMWPAIEVFNFQHEKPSEYDAPDKLYETRGATGLNRVIGYEGDFRTPFTELDLITGKPGKVITPPFPSERGASVMFPDSLNQCILSPQGDRLCWAILFEWPGPAVQEWLHRHCRFIPAPRPQVSLVMWITRLDGSHPYRLGELPGNDLHWIFQESVRWTPDGRRISFVYHNVLYTLPVN